MRQAGLRGVTLVTVMNRGRQCLKLSVQQLNSSECIEADNASSMLKRGDPGDRSE